MTLLEEIKAKEKEDKAFAASLKEAKTQEELVKVLKAAGFEVSMDEVGKTGELSEDELDSVSGGTSQSHLEFMVKWLKEKK